MADPAVDRTLPHNLEAERAVLGAILLDAEAIHQAVEFIDDTRLLPRRPPPHLREDAAT